MCEPFKILAVGELERLVEVSGEANVLVVAQVADLAIARGKLTTYIAGPVGRRVVTDDHLPVGERLGDRGFDCVGDACVPVIDGEADGQACRCGL